MKFPLMLIFIAFLCGACSNQTDVNTELMQAQIDSVFWRTTEVEAIAYDNGAYKITGVSSDMRLEMDLNKLTADGLYEIDSNTNSVVLKMNGKTFSVLEDGRGVVELNRENNHQLSGSFYFYLYQTDSIPHQVKVTDGSLMAIPVDSIDYNL